MPSLIGGASSPRLRSRREGAADGIGDCVGQRTLLDQQCSVIRSHPNPNEGVQRMLLRGCPDQPETQPSTSSIPEITTATGSTVTRGEDGVITVSNPTDPTEPSYTVTRTEESVEVSTNGEVTTFPPTTSMLDFTDVPGGAITFQDTTTSSPRVTVGIGSTVAPGDGGTMEVTDPAGETHAITITEEGVAVST
ncbi:hypothetical protein DID78_01650, partial [Candidatus Marinamargulisbacteria bacterium SCGC AG-343-D04]